MSQAKLRGSFEQRKAQAIERKTLEQEALKAARQARYMQEASAYDIMVWWQHDMSERRDFNIKNHITRDQLMLAQLFGMAYGGLGNGLFR